MRTFSAALIGCAILVAVVVQAEPVQMCPGIASGSIWTACPSVKCASPTSNDDIVQSQVGGGKYWVKLATVPPTGTLARCAAVNGSWWATRQALGIPTPLPAPTPPVPPPAPPTSVEAQSVHALWWQPVQRDTANGLIEVESYKVYQGTKTGVYDKTVSVPGVRYDLSALPPGKYFFAVTALLAGKESAKSAEIAFDMPAAPTPQTPKTLTCAAPTVTDNKTVSLTCSLQ